MSRQTLSKWAMSMSAVVLVNCGGRSELDGDQVIARTSATGGTGTGGSYVSATRSAIPIATGGTATQPGTTAASTRIATGGTSTQPRTTAAFNWWSRRARDRRRNDQRNRLSSEH